MILSVYQFSEEITHLPACHKNGTSHSCSQLYLSCYNHSPLTDLSSQQFSSSLSLGIPLRRKVDRRLLVWSLLQQMIISCVGGDSDRHSLCYLNTETLKCK